MQPDPGLDFLSAKAGHHHVQKNHVRRTGLDHLQCLYERLYTTLSGRISFLLRTPWRCIPRSAEGAPLILDAPRDGALSGAPTSPPEEVKVGIPLILNLSARA